ncbi:hypothetical protein C8Q80DRAFT_357672 [Daedaleopsis nitida]|nr:hypothetical protein C8Q80DRAFT_357672 [Daedaleopsis nitida]
MHPIAPLHVLTSQSTRLMRRGHQLVLRGCELLVVNDAVLSGIARSWPGLKDLHLYSRDQSMQARHDNSTTHTTLHGLASLAGGCPQLRSLIVPISYQYGRRNLPTGSRARL